MNDDYTSFPEHRENLRQRRDRGSAEKRASMEERQAITVRRNLHNFRQLEAAGFPRTVRLELNQWIDSGIVANLIGVVFRKPVVRTHNRHTRIVTMKTKEGYFIHEMEGAKNSPSRTGFAMTKDGKVYRQAQWDERRKCAAVNEMGIIPSRKPDNNKPVRLQDYMGEQRAVTAVPTPSSTEQYSSQVQGSEKFSRAFDNFTRMTLHGAGVEYTRFDAAQEDPLSQVNPSAPSRPISGGAPQPPEAPTEQLPAVPPLDDTQPTMPRVTGSVTSPLEELSANGHTIVSPVDYMPTGRYGRVR